MFRLRRGSVAVRPALVAISVALVCAVTMVFSIYVPQTKGFFNIGETMVYTVALFFGPFVGAIGGGVGSFLADLFLGYPHYAPATLVIKGCEGWIVGLLSRSKPRFNKMTWKAFTLVIGLTVGIVLAFIGSTYYSGEINLYLGIPPPSDPNMVFTILPMLWYAVGALVAFFVALVGFISDPEFGWLVFAMLGGGTVMVAGYYLYQKLLLLPLFGITDIVAEAEIPINVGQMIVGSIIALPIAKIISRSLPELRS